MADTAGMASNAGAGAAAGSSFGPWGAVIGGALGALGSVFGSKKSSKSAKKIAAMQLAWEQQKAQNSIQWATQDAIKAGINPAVAVNTNSNAGSINPPMPDTSGYTSAGQAINSAIGNFIQDKQVETAKKLAESEGFKNVMEGLEAGERTNAIPEQLKNMTRDSLTAMARQKAEERNQEFQNKLLEQQTIYQTFDNGIKEVEKELKTGDFGKTLAKIDMLLDTVKNGGSAMSSFVPIIALWKGATSVKQLGGMIENFKKSNAFKMMNTTYRKRH